MTEQKLTVKTVANILGVSSATISNAFNRPDQLSEKLRKHILSECVRLGYHGPDPTARSLRTGKTGIVGVMLAEKLAYNFNDPCAVEFLEGVSQVLDDARINMLLMPGREEFYREQSIEAIPDSYIIYGPPQDLSLLPRIEARGKRILAVDFTLPNHLSLNVDNYSGAKKAAVHIFNQCKGPVAVIGLRLSKTEKSSRLDDLELRDPASSVSVQRLVAYWDAAKEFNRDIPRNLIWTTSSSTWSEGKFAARQALSTEPRPAALLCMSDQLALAAISVARELNINVPKDLKIVGFDDTPEARRSHPKVTTVYQPSIEKGRLAAMMVLHPDRYESIVLPTTLHIRETTEH